MNPPSLRWLIPGLVLLLGAPEALAAALVDDFSVESVELNTAAPPPFPIDTTQVLNGLGQTVSRTFSVGAATGMAQVQVSQGSFGFIADPASDSIASLGYDSFTADLSATPFLRLDFLSINGIGSMVIELRGASGTQTTGLIGQPLVSGAGTSRFFDVRTFADYQPGFLADVDTVILAFAGTEGPFFDLKLDRISFTGEAGLGGEIPEPAATAGFAGALLGLLGLVRRFRSRSRT